MKRPISRKTLFNIASGGKMFTAVAIAQLVENGRVKFDDPITKYLNGFSEVDRAGRITIRHLLSHTSGVKEYWPGQYDQAVLSATSIDDHLKIVYQAGLKADVEKEYAYCNSNFILLGAIIEKVSGTSFYDYVKQNIFDRAGMTSAGYYGHGTEKVAMGMVRGENEEGWEGGRKGMKGSSAGGAYCSLEDMVAFGKALNAGVLIRKETLTEMATIKNAQRITGMVSFLRG